MDTPEEKQVHADLAARLHADYATSVRRTELANASDRVCAVVWGSAIHDLLKRAVRRNLIKNEAYAARLFGGDGPLANFSVLHNLAHAMGLIGDNIRNDIHCVREIRNAFAHNVTVIDDLGKPARLTFSTTKIADHCRNLRCPKFVPRREASLSAQLTFERLGWTVPECKFIYDTPRNLFQWTCECLGFILSTLAYGPRYPNATHVETTKSQQVASLVSDWTISGSPIDYPHE